MTWIGRNKYNVGSSREVFVLRHSRRCFGNICDSTWVVLIIGLPCHRHFAGLPFSCIFREARPVYRAVGFNKWLNWHYINTYGFSGVACYLYFESNFHPKSAVAQLVSCLTCDWKDDGSRHSVCGRTSDGKEVNTHPYCYCRVRSFPTQLKNQSYPKFLEWQILN